MKKSVKGQVILIILLLMAVGLTIGLSVAGRSVTDVRLSNQIEESSRAFSAAEAGIEQVLNTGLGSAGDIRESIDDTTSYNVNLTPLGGSGATFFAFPGEVPDADGQILWLVPLDTNGNPITATPTYTASSIEICWKQQSVSAVVPALEVTLFYYQGGQYKLGRAAYDPEAATRGNSFSNDDSGSCNCSGILECTSLNFDYYKVLTFSTDFSPAVINPGDTLIALRLRPVYASTNIGVLAKEGLSIPEQGKNIISTGQTDSGVTRKWQVEHTYPAPRDIFDYAVWSNTDLSK